MLLSPQTRKGIEITIRGFIGAVKYLLSVGVKYVMAAIFNQDRIEQNFGKQRAACGGGRNPTVHQYMHNQNSIYLQRKLRLKRKGANTEADDDEESKLDDTPLPKRPKTSARRLIMPQHHLDAVMLQEGPSYEDAEPMEE